MNESPRPIRPHATRWLSRTSSSMSAPMPGVHRPAHTTAASHLTVPRSVTTAEMRPLVRRSDTGSREPA